MRGGYGGCFRYEKNHGKRYRMRGDGRCRPPRTVQKNRSTVGKSERKTFRTRRSDRGGNKVRCGKDEFGSRPKKRLRFYRGKARLRSLRA